MKSTKPKSSKASKVNKTIRGLEHLLDRMEEELDAEDLDCLEDEWDEEEDLDESGDELVPAETVLSPKQRAKKDAMKDIKDSEKKLKRVRKTAEKVTKTVDPSGITYWRNAHGQYHRTDGPAWIDGKGTEQWYQNGQLHRTDGPAYLHSNGTKQWFQNGQMHRADGPASELPNGDYQWFTHGRIYRPNQEGPSSKMNGFSHWYNQAGQLHRVEGPAQESSEGEKYWYVNGKLHRLDGPAVEFLDGYQEYWLNGKQYDLEQYQARIGKSATQVTPLKTIDEIWGELIPLFDKCSSSIFSTWDVSTFTINGITRTEQEVRDLLEDLQISVPLLDKDIIRWYKRGKDGNPTTIHHRKNGPAVSSTTVDHLRLGRPYAWCSYFLDGNNYSNDGWEKARALLTQQPPTTSPLSAEIQAATHALKQMSDQIEAANKLLEEKIEAFKKSESEFIAKQQAEFLPKQEALKQELADRLEEKQRFQVMQKFLDAELKPVPYNPANASEIFDEWIDYVCEEWFPADHQATRAYEVLATVLNSYLLGMIEITSDAEMEAHIQGYASLPQANLHDLYLLSMKDCKAADLSYLYVGDKDPLVSSFRDELTSAGYRIAATQITNLSKTLLIKALPEEKVPTLNSILDSEVGTGLIALMAGWGLTYALPDNPKVQTLANEFRIRGLATFGNAAVESLMGAVFEAIKTAVDELPANLDEVAPPTKETASSTEILRAEEAIATPSIPEVVPQPTVIVDEELDELEEVMALQSAEKDLSIN